MILNENIPSPSHPAPLVALRLVGYCTTKNTVTVRAKLPLWALKVKGYIPGGVAPLVFTVNVTVPDPVSELCDQLFVAPGIKATPYEANLAVPLKPPIGISISLYTA
jgi:hypothetical protein